MAEQQLSAPTRDRHGLPRAGVTHIRHRHTERFTVVGNHLAQHDDLSLVAIGLAVHIQSRPDGALVTIKTLTADFPEGEVAIARALRELEAAGYLVRAVERLPDGRRVTRTYAYDCPEQHRQRPAAANPAAPHPPPTPKPPTTPKPPPPPTTAPRAPAEPAEAPACASPEASGSPGPSDSPEAPHATALLATLRTHDPRLLLSERDATRLAPALTAWLERGIHPDAAVRTLTADLPTGHIRRPAALLTYRLTQWLPPALPAGLPGGPRPVERRPYPFQDCDRCDHPYRGPEPGLCRDCRDEAETEAEAETLATASAAAA